MSRTIQRGGGALRAAVVATALVAVLAAQAALQRHFDNVWPRRRMEQLLYIPEVGISDRGLKALTLGFSNLAADAFWIKAISYFGGHAITDRNYPWLAHILDQVTTLDPLFKYPYLFGGVVLAVERESGPESIALLVKGMTRYPGDWRYPFYIGFSSFYLQQDPEQASKFMRYAATLPESPEYVRHLAASLMAESGRVDAAIRFLETVAEGTRQDWERAKIYTKIEDLRAGRVPERLRGFLSGTGKP